MNVKFVLLRDALKSDQMFFKFELFRESKNYDGITKTCLEYVKKHQNLGWDSSLDLSADEEVRQGCEGNQD